MKKIYVISYDGELGPKPQWQNMYAIKVVDHCNSAYRDDPNAFHIINETGNSWFDGKSMKIEETIEISDEAFEQLCHEKMRSYKQQLGFKYDTD